MSDPQLERIRHLEKQVAELRRARVTYRTAEVTATDGATFTAAVGGTELLGGIEAPAQFMPAIGDKVRLTLSGAVPLYEPAGIAENAVTGREIAPGAVDVDQLAFELSDYTGGTTIFYGPDTPTAGAVGDLWLQSPDNVAYRWDGATWAEVRDQGVVAALQEAQAAQQAADQALADALAANQAADSKTTVLYQATAPTGASTGDLWVKTPENLLNRWDGDSWEPIQDTAISTALTQAATAQSTADGKVRIFTQTTAPTGMVAGDVGDMWIDTDDGNRLYTWSGTDWTSRQLGNSAIQPQSLIASNVIATGTVSASLLEAIMVLASTIIAGNPNSAHARMTPQGFFVYAVDPATGTPRIVIRLGAGSSDYLAIVNAAGELLTTIDERGVISARGLSTVEMPSFAGVNLQDMFNRQPRGIIAIGQRDFSNGLTGIVGEEPLFDVAATIDRSRIYKVHLSGYDTNVSGGVTQTVQHRVRMSYGDTPTITNQIVMDKQQTASANLGMAADFTTDWPGVLAFENFPEETRLVRFGMSIGKGGNTGNSLGLAGLITLSIEDVGPAVQSVVTFNPGGQGYGSTAPVVSAPATERRVLERVANWSRSFTPTNGINDDPNVYQGYNASTGGDMAGMWGFPDMTAELAGSIIERIDVYLYATHWHYNSGGTAIISTHAQLNEPATWSKFESDPDNLVNFLKPEGKWVGLDINRYATRLINGSFRGITVGRGGGTNLQFYGRFHGAGEANPARIRVQYVK